MWIGRAEQPDSAEGDEMFEVKQREVAAQLVLTEQRTVGVAELAEWLPSTMGRLGKSAVEFGGLAGNWFVVYHGQFAEDGGGEVPVEVCAPISSDQERPVTAAVRDEPAHREAYVTLTKAQADPAGIAAAFAMVGRWVGEHGLTIADAPREVYFTDFTAAAPDDEVLDVAFPIR